MALGSPLDALGAYSAIELIDGQLLTLIQLSSYPLVTIATYPLEQPDLSRLQLAQFPLFHALFNGFSSSFLRPFFVVSRVPGSSLSSSILYSFLPTFSTVNQHDIGSPEAWHTAQHL